MSDGRYAGVDWASEEHAVCVVDEQGRIIEGRRYSHNEPGIRALCARLLRLRVALVALERPDGLLIERLLDAGLAVIAVHPNQVKAMRPRYSVAGGKSDGFDSFVLAELARTDSHRFRVLEPDSDQTKALRAMTRARDGLVRTRVGLANQLRDQLATFWPGAGKVFCAVDSPIALAFLRRYPTPVDARGLGEQRLAVVSQAPQLHRSQTSARAARPAAQWCRGTRRRARDGSSPRDRARARGRPGTDRRPDQRADDRDPPRTRSAPRRADVPLAVHRPGLVAMRRDDALRDRRLPRALPHLPGIGRRRRPSARRGRVRESQTRPIPLGLRPPPPRSVLHPRRLKPPPQPLGSGHLPARPRSRRRPHPRHTHPRPRLVHRSSGASGTTTTPTTPTNTPPSNASSQPKVDTGGLFAAAHDRSQSGSRRRLLFRSNRKRGLLVKIC